MAIHFNQTQKRTQKKAAQPKKSTSSFKEASNTPEPNARKPILKAEEQTDDLSIEPTIRPKTLDDYIGQSALKDSLMITLEAAQQRNEALDHLLFYGPPGMGKTTLSMILAQSMGQNIHITSAPALERPRDIVGILMGLDQGDVLFIDEIHRLNKVTEEILYPAMEDFQLDRTVGKGPAAKVLRVPLPKFTLIGATTKAGSIASPLRDRFGLMMRMEFYTPEELQHIVQRSAGILNIQIDPTGAQAIAKRSRGTPRIANRLLRRVRDFAAVKSNKTHIDEPLAEEALDLFHIDPLGLDNTDRMLLTLMLEQFNGGPVGIESLAAALGEDARTLEDVYEPFLLQSGLIQRTTRGRCVTAKAAQHLGLSHSLSTDLQASLF